MNYESITEVIKVVTGLNVPVYFNDMEANYMGSPYFGVGEHGWDIMPEDMIDNPMFDIVDFIENKHLKFFHVGIPETILKKNMESAFNVTAEQFKTKGIHITLTKALLDTFVILHEFGHAHELFVAYKGDVERYLGETTQANRKTSYEIKMYGLAGTEEGLKLHKSTATEQYADNYALQYFEAVVKVARERQLL